MVDVPPFICNLNYPILLLRTISKRNWKNKLHKKNSHSLIVGMQALNEYMIGNLTFLPFNYINLIKYSWGTKGRLQAITFIHKYNTQGIEYHDHTKPTFYSFKRKVSTNTYNICIHMIISYIYLLINSKLLIT